LVGIAGCLERGPVFAIDWHPSASVFGFERDIIEV
jgi:hypothetical protein